jgi:hypothetical protein
MTSKDIQTQIARTITKETQAVVEVTLISETRLSIFADRQVDIDAAVRLLNMIPSLSLVETASYPEDSMFVAFYNY